MEPLVLWLEWQPIWRLTILLEVVDATVAYIDNREIDIAGLMQYVKAPDFPTEVSSMDMKVLETLLRLEEEKVVMRAKTSFEEVGNREAIIVSEIPLHG